MVLCRELGKPSAVNGEHGIDKDQEPIRSLSHHGGEDAIELLWIPGVHTLKVKLQRSSRSLDLAQLVRMGWVRWI